MSTRKKIIKIKKASHQMSWKVSKKVRTETRVAFWREIFLCRWSCLAVLSFLAWNSGQKKTGSAAVCRDACLATRDFLFSCFKAEDKCVSGKQTLLDVCPLSILKGDYRVLKKSRRTYLLQTSLNFYLNVCPFLLKSCRRRRRHSRLRSKWVVP